MNFPHDFASQQLIQNIGVTLLCSLAMGLILAILTASVLLFTRKSKATLRYNLLTTLLCLFTVSVCAVLYQQVNSSHLEEITSRNHLSPALSDNAFISDLNSDTSLDFKEIIRVFLTGKAQPIAMVWLLVVLFKTLQMGKGLYDLSYLRRNKVYTIGKDWQDRIEDLALQIGIRQSVKVMQSGLVKIPMVMGHFKPVILIPLGMIANIPADQVEMIVLHELAHIKRMDFFVNLLQHFVEVLFFFNPAVLWISSLIRKERENCCDDIAVRFSGSKKTYINALLSFREYQMEDSVYAVAFTQSSSLVERAKRIAFQKNTTLKLSEKVFVSVTLLLLFTFTLLLAQVSKTENEAAISQNNLQKKASDSGIFTLPAKHISDRDRSEAELLSSRSIEKLKEQVAELTTIKRLKSADSLLKLQDKLLNLNAVSLQLDTIPEYRNTLILEPIVSLQPVVHYTSGDSSRYSNYYGGYSKPTYQFEKKITLFKTIKPGIYDRILDEIGKAGVVFDRTHVQFHITNTELTVDGVKQSEEIHKQVLSKFVKKPGDTVDFTLNRDNK